MDRPPPIEQDDWVVPPRRVAWPGGKAFAFSIFDDPDSQTLPVSRLVYQFLAEQGLLTTKGVWPNGARPGEASDHGETCANPELVSWLQGLQEQGFELGYHNATSHTSTREETLRGLDRFRELFGQDPGAMSNHYHSKEAIYWGANRLSGVRRACYQLLTLGRSQHCSFGHVPGDARFWGDLCRERIRYVRNFVFADINTLKQCPYMPYHDPARPYVRQWFASSEAANVGTAVQQLAEARQERLEAEGGACILYVHFGHGFADGGRVNARFAELIRRLARRPGWFVPVSRLLDYLGPQRPGERLSPAQRRRLELRWLWHKARFGAS